MIVSNRRFDSVVDDLRDEIKWLKNRLWEVQFSHARLLDELGYTEERVYEHKKLVKKGGPEPG